MPFSKETLDFLFENRLHDSREWFMEHKEDYQRLVIEPLKELTRSLTDTMLKIDANFTTEPRVDKTICRIWRDTRFTHDPSLYRDNMWIIFRRGKMHNTDFPGMYFEISGEGFNYGCGFYHASTSYMNTLRGMIQAREPSFALAQKALLSQSVFHIEGECYKRPHFSDQPEELRQWLERRGISFIADSRDFELLFSDRLAEKLCGDYQLLSPIYQFLMEAASREMQSRADLEAEQRG